MIRTSIQGPGNHHHRQLLKGAVMYTRITTGRYDTHFLEKYLDPEAVLAEADQS